MLRILHNNSEEKLCMTVILISITLIEYDLVLINLFWMLKVWTKFHKIRVWKL